MNDSSPEKENQAEEKEILNTDDSKENSLLPLFLKNLFEKNDNINENQKISVNNPEQNKNTLINTDNKPEADKIENEDLYYEEKESDIFDSNAFKKDNNNFKKENNLGLNSKENQQDDKIQKINSMPQILPESINHSNQINPFPLPNTNNDLNSRRMSGENNGFFINNFNNYQNNINFINSSFSKDGKTGWVCSACQNFNYESKYKNKLIYINFFIK